MVTAQQTTTANVVKTQPPAQDNGNANGNGKATEPKTVGAMDGAGEQEKVYTGSESFSAGRLGGWRCDSTQSDG